MANENPELPAGSLRGYSGGHYDPGQKVTAPFDITTSIFQLEAGDKITVYVEMDGQETWKKESTLSTNPPDKTNVHTIDIPNDKLTTAQLGRISYSITRPAYKSTYHSLGLRVEHYGKK
jgi:hypothetical protein